MSEPVWEDPPATKHGNFTALIWVERLLPLMEHPGRWACLGRFGRGVAGNLKSGKVRKPPGTWEFVSRSFNASGEQTGRTEAWVYARFMGDEPSATAVDH